MKEKPVSFKEQLRLKGYKSTSQRQAILDIITNCEGKHLSSEEIYALVREKNPDIGLATVYRTLQLLERMELVYKLDFDDGVSRYELNKHTEDHRHHHLICTSCGAVSEVEVDLLDALEEQIRIKNNFLVKDHRVKFYGLCGKCLEDVKN